MSPVRSIHHVQFYVSNALQASFWYCFNFGFKRFASRRSKSYSEVAIKNGEIILTFKCSLRPDDVEIGPLCSIRGDFAKDVAFSVDDVNSIVAKVKEFGHTILEMPTEIGDENGMLKIARIAGSAGSITHFLIQNIDYKGIFMPGFHPINDFNSGLNLSPISFNSIDHVVEAHKEHTLSDVTTWYNKILALQRFWSIDDQSVHTEFSALSALLVGNSDKRVKITLVEPVRKSTKGQVEEFLDYNGSQGIQHIAFSTDDICTVVDLVKKRSVEFLDIPDSYYDRLEQRLRSSPINISEDLQRIRELNILVDFDQKGYLLQIFTKPVQDRPTLFLEIIQRHNYDGFGAGNFKALFEAVEMEQKKREIEMAGELRN